MSSPVQPPDWRPLASVITPALRANLDDFAARDPEWRVLIERGARDEALWAAAAGGMFLCKTGGPDGAWVAPPDAAERAARTADGIPGETRLLVLMGSAAGHLLPRALEWLGGSSRRRILWLEPSAARLRAAACWIGLRAAADTGRVHFAAGPLTDTAALQAVRRFNLRGAAPVHVLAPDGDAFPIDTAAMARRIEEESAAIEPRRARTLETLAEKRPKHVRAVRRALLIDCWRGAPGQLHLRAIAAELKKRGVETRTLAANRYQIETRGPERQRAAEPELLAALGSFQPDAIISYGYHGRQLAAEDVIDASGAVWLQMVSNICHFDTRYHPAERTGLIERRLIPYVERRGAVRPFFAPLMADFAAPRTAPTNRSMPVVFVGNSLGLHPAERAALLEGWKPRERLYSYVLEAERALSAFDVNANLYDYLEAHPLPQCETLEDEHAVFRFLLCESTAARRTAILEKAAPLGLALFGGDWRLEAGSPLAPCLRGYLNIEDEPKIFQHGAVFLNIHSTGHVTGPNMRFFNTPGLGGMQLCDAQPAFADYLAPDREALYFASAEECVEKIRFCLANPQWPDEIRARGLARIQADWTYRRWADIVESELGIAWGASA